MNAPKGGVQPGEVRVVRGKATRLYEREEFARELTWRVHEMMNAAVRLGLPVPMTRTAFEEAVVNWQYSPPTAKRKRGPRS